ncbi:AlpA family phage regulatory protein [Photobacterium leiognathi]|nr:AlpA family phage regulatory protein [Photobacterium leiognathi]
MRLKKMMHICSLDRSSIYKFIEDGRFPQKLLLGDRAETWIETEVEE